MTNEINIRELILDTLLQITRQEEYSHIIIRRTLEKYRYLDQRERKFYKRVCEGTLEHLIHIDYIIESFSSVKIDKMKPVIRNILRSAVYEIIFMDKVPDAAACNEAVKLTIKKGFRNLKGFVNGVLRNIARQSTREKQTIEENSSLEEMYPIRIPYPDQDKEPIRYLSVLYSMPEWIIRLFLESYDRERVEQILKSFFKTYKTSIRVNTDKIGVNELIEELKKEKIDVAVNELVSYGLFLSNYDSISGIKAFQDGLFYVQDVSSMLLAEYAGVKENDYVIDVCAAPGGKSLHIAELLKGSGMVEARDLTSYKTKLIQENIDRLKLKNIKAVLKDATKKDEFSVEKADIVIADLPCSGLGVIGKKPDIKYNMTLEKQEELKKLQREILHTVQSYVKPGGVLMYSTCTINRNENEENVEWFRKEYPEFSLAKQVQLLPDEGEFDGFFIAKLLKKNGKINE